MDQLGLGVVAYKGFLFELKRYIYLYLIKLTAINTFNGSAFVLVLIIQWCL